MGHFTGTAGRVGGDDDEVRVEMEDNRGNFKTFVAEGNMADHAVNFIDPGKQYTVDYVNPDPTGEEPHDGSITNITPRS